MSNTESGFDILSLFDDTPQPQLDISQDIALRVRNLHVRFKRQHVLKGVNFDVKRGEVLVRHSRGGSRQLATGPVDVLSAGVANRRRDAVRP